MKNLVVVGLVVASVFSLVVVLKVVHWDEIPQERFNSHVWRRTGSPKESVSQRRPMLRDLINRILPGLCEEQMEDELGQAQRPLVRDPIRSKTNVIYLDDYLEYEWDLAYCIGRPSEMSMMQRFFWPILGGEYEPEYLLIRLGNDGCFESWYIVDFGQTPWEEIVGSPGNKAYRESR